MTVIAKEGTIAWSKPPAPVTLCTNCCAQEIGEAVIKALSGSGPDRFRHPEERRRVPPDDGDREGGDDRVVEAARAGHAVHQLLRPGDRRGGDQGALRL